MLKEEMWKVFKNTGDIEAYLYYKQIINTSDSNTDISSYIDKKVIQAQ